MEYGPGPNHPASKAIANRANDKNRVIDLSASRKVKESTGRAVGVPLSSSEESPSFAKHADEAIAINKPAETKTPSLYKRGMGYLGLLGDEDK